jgi:hypothetical protein
MVITEIRFGCRKDRTDPLVVESPPPGTGKFMKQGIASRPSIGFEVVKLYP